MTNIITLMSTVADSCRFEAFDDELENIIRGESDAVLSIDLFELENVAGGTGDSLEEKQKGMKDEL